MGQKSIVLYLNRKGWTAQIMRDDLVATLGEEPFAYRTVTKCFREAQSAMMIGPHYPRNSHLTSTIQMRLFSAPLMNSRSLQFGSFIRATHLPKTTVPTRLSEKLGFIARHLRRVLDIPLGDRKSARVQCSKCLLTILRGQKPRDSHEIVTLDQSSFY
jgi:hypothetical protein